MVSRGSHLPSCTSTDQPCPLARGRSATHQLKDTGDASTRMLLHLQGPAEREGACRGPRPHPAGHPSGKLTRPLAAAPLFCTDWMPQATPICFLHCPITAPYLPQFTNNERFRALTFLEEEVQDWDLNPDLARTPPLFHWPPGPSYPVLRSSQHAPFQHCSL